MKEHLHPLLVSLRARRQRCSLAVWWLIQQDRTCVSMWTFHKQETFSRNKKETWCVVQRLWRFVRRSSCCLTQCDISLPVKEQNRIALCEIWFALWNPSTRMNKRGFTNACEEPKNLDFDFNLLLYSFFFFVCWSDQTGWVDHRAGNNATLFQIPAPDVFVKPFVLKQSALRIQSFTPSPHILWLVDTCGSLSLHCDLERFGWPSGSDSFDDVM